MFKVRELIAQTSMSIAGFLLTVVNSRLYFDEKPLATLSGNVILPGMMLTLTEDGHITQVDNVSKVSIHIDPANGDDTGYGTEASPLATLDAAIVSADKYKMFSYVEFILYDHCQLNTGATLAFPSEIRFKGANGGEYTVTVNIGATIPSLEINASTTIMFDGINIAISGTTATLGAIITGHPSALIMFHSDITLIENVALMESYHNLDVRMIDATINNSAEKIFINNGGGRVQISGDSNSSFSEPNSTDVCYYIASNDENYSASFL